MIKSENKLSNREKKYSLLDNFAVILVKNLLNSLIHETISDKIVLESVATKNITRINLPSTHSIAAIREKHNIVTRKLDAVTEIK